MCGWGKQGVVAMEMKCLYFSCRAVTFSPEDGGFKACNWAKPSVRSAEQTTTCDPKGCCDLSSWSNALSQQRPNLHGARLTCLRSGSLLWMKHFYVSGDLTV